MASILHAYIPGKAFPALSVTGTACDLMCDHCQARYLRGMLPARSLDELLETLEALRWPEANGLLLSGGCDVNGMVPLDGAVEALVEGRHAGLRVNLHPGICDERRARYLAPAADTVSLDLLCDDEAARCRLFLPSAQGHIDTIRAWMGKGPEVVPHLLVGLGSEAAEMEGLELCHSLGIRRLILLSLIPRPGFDAMPHDRLLRVAKAAMEAVPTVVLGCMRPRKTASLENACLDLGVRHIANPTRGAMAHAREMGLEVRTHQVCCSLS